ncbi:MAG: NAD(P)H nitroreductase [Alteromonadaceae bacterium]|nr:NAD(P)H nitroreductase [Alteromonadaceae bacterium]
MNSTELLLTRQSTAQLTSPAPDQTSLDTILKAAMRVPDHGALTPWHFTLVTGNGLNTLSEIFTQAAKQANFNEAKTLKAGKMPYRAPLIIVVSSNIVEHEKVPKQEQIITAACCVHAMQMAAFSLGYGAMWRTGDFAYSRYVKQQLSIDEKDEIIGFLYVGTVVKQAVIKASKSYKGYLSHL